MRKIISVFMIAFMLLLVSGCTVEDKKEEKRTYKADGTYMVWELNQTSTTLLRADGVTKVMTDDNKEQKVNTPVLSMVKVTIVNDKVVKYEIDELQSKAFVSKTRQGAENYDEETNTVKGVTWEFNAKTKRELEYGYNMENQSPQGEWYIHALRLESYWLEKGEPVSDDTIKASVTITFDNYVEMAKKALQNAKDGKIGAITDKEHYTYDVTFVNANINEKGKISNVKLNAWLFGNTGTNTYVKGHADYLKFAWNEKDKYASYPAMSNEKMWQAQIDALNAYINEKGWDTTLVSGTGTGAEYKDKGVNIGGQPVDALASVTIQLSREVLVMNMLYEFFPKGWK